MSGRPGADPPRGVRDGGPLPPPAILLPVLSVLLGVALGGALGYGVAGASAPWFRAAAAFAGGVAGLLAAAVLLPLFAFAVRILLVLAPPAVLLYALMKVP